MRSQRTSESSSSEEDLWELPFVDVLTAACKSSSSSSEQLKKTRGKQSKRCDPHPKFIQARTVTHYMESVFTSTINRNLGRISRTLNRQVAWSAGASLMRANVISSQSFIRPAMFELELEWMVEVEDRGLGNSEKKNSVRFLLTIYTLTSVKVFSILFPYVL